jgi:hypothetical protein
MYYISDCTVYFVGCVTHKQVCNTDVCCHRFNVCDLIAVKLRKFGHLVVAEDLVKISIFGWETARSQWDKMQTSSLNRRHLNAILA